MALPIKHDLKPSALAMIRGRMWNAVARICSYWTGGKHIIVRKPEHPSSQNPITWDLDTKSAAPDIAKEFDRQDLWSVALAENEDDIPLNASASERTDLLEEFAEEAPVEDSIAPVDESDEDKVRRIGKSDKAARADHVHPVVNTSSLKEFEAPTVYLNTSPEHKGNALLDTEWERGQTDKDGNPVGVKLYLPTDSWDDQSVVHTAWRLCEFDSLGGLQKVRAQTIKTEAPSLQLLLQ